MAITDDAQLLEYLSVFPVDVQDRALWLRNFVWDRYPLCNELVYDNYNALAFGWSITAKLSHTFCNVAIMRANNHVVFGFYWGNHVPDPQNLLIGNGKQFRYFSVDNIAAVPETYLEELMRMAHAYSLSLVTAKDQHVEGSTIYKSVSPVKRATSKKIRK